MRFCEYCWVLGEGSKNVEFVKLEFSPKLQVAFRKLVSFLRGPRQNAVLVVYWLYINISIVSHVIYNIIRHYLLRERGSTVHTSIHTVYRIIYKQISKTWMIPSKQKNKILISIRVLARYSTASRPCCKLQQTNETKC